MGYDGLDRIAEYDGSNAVQRRYIHGPGVDQPITWYEGSGLSDSRFLSSDERGSIISTTGSATVLNKYDEFGVPQTGNSGKFGYTGQAWVPEIGLWYYKARFYRPDIGRFMQTDPIGYGGDGPNLYAYVLNDPVNWVDPLGLRCGPGEIAVNIGGYNDGDAVVAIIWCKRLPHTEGPRGNPGGTIRERGGIAEEGGVPSPAEQQQEACQDPKLRALLRNPTVQSRMADAMRRAQSTPNLGINLDIPAFGSEHGFWAGTSFAGTTVTGAIRTDRRERQVAFVLPPFSVLISGLTAIHTHQSPRGSGVLSGADIGLSIEWGVNIVAINEDGKIYCRVAG